MKQDDYPKAYTLGYQEFYGRKFLVTRDVLIPRPETEIAIDMVLSLAGKPYLPGVSIPEARLESGAKILDVGTGSGCIAITIKLELPEMQVIAADISDSALAVAKNNAKKLSAGVKFLHSDLLDGFAREERFDLIVANLPYVDRKWDWLSESESASIKYEPELALFAEKDGLELIMRLLKQAMGRTRFLLIEADPIQHAVIRKEAAENGFRFEKANGFQLLFEASE